MIIIIYPLYMIGRNPEACGMIKLEPLQRTVSFCLSDKRGAVVLRQWRGRGVWETPPESCSNSDHYYTGSAIPELCSIAERITRTETGGW